MAPVIRARKIWNLVFIEAALPYEQEKLLARRAQVTTGNVFFFEPSGTDNMYMYTHIHYISGVYYIEFHCTLLDCKWVGSLQVNM